MYKLVLFAKRHTGHLFLVAPLEIGTILSYTEPVQGNLSVNAPAQKVQFRQYFPD